MKVLVCACVCVGCHGGAAQGPDGGPDAGPIAPGVHVGWLTNPALPGAFGDITISEVTFKVQNLRVIGDVGSTDSSDATLEWNATETPKPVDFPTAPAGLYSKLTLQLDGEIIDSSFEIQGTVVVAGTTHPFDIHDRDESKITLDCNATLAPDGGLLLPVRVDFASALGVIDFTKVDDDNGMLDLDTDDDQMSAFRDKLVDSFGLASVATP